MAHALIIGDNMIISRAIENCLISLGFNSFDRTLTEAQALAVAECRPPDLVVIDKTVACGSASIVAEHMVEQFETPIILMTAGQCEVRRRLPQGAILDGPFLLSDMGNAVAVARCSGAVSVPTTKPAFSPCLTQLDPCTHPSKRSAPNAAPAPSSSVAMTG